jgi:RNA-directed DNA polymerase
MARRRARDLWPQVTAFSALHAAAHRALRGKRTAPAACAFFVDLERNLFALQSELEDGSYRPGDHHIFEIRDPKPRLISAAPFRDRVVHHALVAVIEPHFERRFIHHSYACRVGKGQHRALATFRGWARGCPTLLKLDVRKYFPSIDHALLLARFADVLADPRVLALLGHIVGGARPAERVRFYFPGDDLFTPDARPHGLPIGNLTSQLAANVFLDPIDHLVTARLGLGRYLRYMDDLVVFHEDPGRLREARAAIEAALLEQRLRLNDGKSRLHRLDEGVPFLGFVHRDGHARLAPSAVRRRRRRTRALREAYAEAAIGFADVAASFQAWEAHAAHGDTAGLARAIRAATVLRRARVPARAPDLADTRPRHTARARPLAVTAPRWSRAAETRTMACSWPGCPRPCERS